MSEEGRMATEPAPSEGAANIEIRPATPERWADLAALFGPRGACGGCWCMWWRLPRAGFGAAKGEGNREALCALVASGKAPGLLAYADSVPVGWCALAPREAYPALGRSRILKPVDDQPVWSVTNCSLPGQSTPCGRAGQALREPTWSIGTCVSRASVGL
jgi:hypothetical protein